MLFEFAVETTTAYVTSRIPGPLGQKRHVGKSSIRQSCAAMRHHARSLNTLARACFIRPEGNFFVRQCRALLRSS